VEAVAPESGQFNWKDYYMRALAALDEPLHLVERLSAAQFEPVVCISSDGNPATIRQAMAHGARAYVVRPSTAAELEHAIVDAFERERQRRTLASGVPAEKRGQVVTILAPRAASAGRPWPPTWPRALPG